MRNPNIDFEDLLRHLHSLVEGTYADPSATDYPRYLGYLDLAVAEAWDSEWWPDLMECEERYFRDDYDAANDYVAGDEVYYPDTQLYYQCVQANAHGSPHAPATGSPLVENSAYWAECATSYSASDWVDGTAYVVGDQCFYPVTNRYYQCHTDHTASATLTPDATGADERWGQLAGFNRYVPWSQTGLSKLGDIFDVKDSDPRLGHSWDSIAWAQSKDGVQILEECDFVWIQYRRRRPELKGALYDSSASYAVDDQVYFVPSGEKGNLYDCAAASDPAESPSTYPSQWTQVAIPQMFKNFLIWSAYARCLVADGKHESVSGARALADDYLALETDRLYRQSAQTPSLPVRTY